jgi:hypothetical protein
LINFDRIEIVDYWEADLCAIALKSGNKLVYISTFNNTTNIELNYDFDCEIIDPNDKGEINVVRKERKVSENELVEGIKLFLEL